TNRSRSRKLVSGLAFASPLQSLVYVEHVGEHRTQVYLGVQVIDELRADIGLRKDEADRAARRRGIAFHRLEELGARREHFVAAAGGAASDGGPQTLESVLHGLEKIADVAARTRPAVAVAS